MQTYRFRHNTHIDCDRAGSGLKWSGLTLPATAIDVPATNLLITKDFSEDQVGMSLLLARLYSPECRTICLARRRKNLFL
jgi:hypothetical protein